LIACIVGGGFRSGTWERTRDRDRQKKKISREPKKKNEK
jgi:hypothetical protein